MNILCAMPIIMHPKNQCAGIILMSILADHSRYAHITGLMGDGVNFRLLGITKVVSDDSARKALRKIDEEEGVHWLQNQMAYYYSPLFSQSWILDAEPTFDCQVMLNIFSRVNLN